MKGKRDFKNLNECLTCGHKFIHHKRCSVCGMLIHDWETCDCLVGVEERIKDACCICDREFTYENELKRKVTRHVKQGNFCTMCNSKCHKKAMEKGKDKEKPKILTCYLDYLREEKKKKNG